MTFGGILLGNKYKDISTGIVGVAVAKTINWHNTDSVTLEWISTNKDEVCVCDYPVTRLTTYSE